MQTIEDTSMPALVVLGSAIAASALYAVTTQPRTKKLDSSEGKKSVATLAPRLPTTSFLLGELPAYLMNGHRVHDWITDKCLQMDGRLWRMVIPGQSDLVMISEPAIVEEVAQAKFDSFPRGPVQIEMLGQLFGASLINSDGTRWYHQRKAAAKFFTANSLRACMTTTMHKNIGQVNAVIDKNIAEDKWFDLEAVFHGFTMQTFAEVGLGIDLPWIGSTERSPVQEHFAMASAATFRRHRVPPLVWKFERALHIGVERELADGMAEVREWITTVVDDCLAAVAKRQAGDATEEVKSMVELFLQHSDEGVEGMGPDDLVDFILSFVLAAFETSASALCWFFLSVIKHPEVAAKIKEEMARELPLLGVTDRDTYLTTTHVNKLLYLDATIKEMLRLYPGIPLYQRQASRDEVIGGYTFIPKGTSIAVSPYAMARLPQIWGPDAAEFKPERWIDEAKQELRSVPNHKMPSFGAGPRSCIGMKLAMLQLRVVTANLLHRYDFALAAPNSGDHVAALSLAMKEPLIVSATRREQL